MAAHILHIDLICIEQRYKQQNPYQGVKMNIRTSLAIGLLSVLAVSCAHKKIEQETVTTNEVPVSKKIEKEKVIVKSEKSSNGLSMNCVLNKDSRVITLQKGEKRCEVHYTKFGELNEIAWGEKTPSICDNVFENVKSNIEKGGFKCSPNETTASL
jgi:hypothetical protein